MSNTLYTATGCSRCKIAKNFMDERGIAYRELDIKAEGKEAFGQFYRNNRSAVFRGREGIEFPVFTDGTVIRQGVGVIIAFLHAGTRLDGFVGRSDLSHGWMDGIHVSEGEPALSNDLAAVLSYIKSNGLTLQVDTDGRNASVLERLLQENLADRVVMDLKGPLDLYGRILGREIDPEEVKRTIGIVARFPEYRFRTTVAPVIRQEGTVQDIGFLTPEEIAQTAGLIREATGNHKQPYVLRIFEPESALDERLRSVKRLTANDLLRHRSAARKYQVLTEIEKSG
jgi:pyruvate-formate lyase-activating enzyme/glutaredoxin